MRREPKASNNTNAENRTYSFRLDRRVPKEAETRRLLDSWIVEGLEHSKTLRDVISELVLRFAGSPLAISSNDSLSAKLDDLAATVESQGERLSSEMNDQTQTIMRILSQLRSNPTAFQEYVERADGENDELDANFIGNLLDNLGR